MTRARVFSVHGAVVATCAVTAWALTADPYSALFTAILTALLTVCSHALWRTYDLADRPEPDLSRYATKGDLGSARVYFESELQLLHDCKADVVGPVPRQVPRQNRRAS